MTQTMLGLDRANRTIRIYTNPYWYKDNIYIGTKLNSKEEYPIYKNDAYFFDGDLRHLINKIRLIGNKIGSVELKRADGFLTTMSVMNGYCSILSTNIHSMFLFFEDRTKTMDNMIIRLDIADGAYHVTSKFCVKDKVYYQDCKPNGKSYDDVLDALDELGIASSESIADFLEIDRNRVSGRLTEMERSGMVKRNGYTKSKHGVSVIAWRKVNA